MFSKWSIAPFCHKYTRIGIDSYFVISIQKLFFSPQRRGGAEKLELYSKSYQHFHRVFAALR